MAIIWEYPDLEAAVVVHDQRLQEYDDDECKAKTVTKCIKAITGVEAFPFPLGDLPAGIWFNNEYIETIYVRPESFLP